MQFIDNEDEVFNWEFDGANVKFDSDEMDDTDGYRDKIGVTELRIEKDGSSYEGERIKIHSYFDQTKGIKVGRGIHILKDGSRYDGFFKNDLRNKYGREITAKGIIYTG